MTAHKIYNTYTFNDVRIASDGLFTEQMFSSHSLIMDIWNAWQSPFCEI